MSQSKRFSYSFKPIRKLKPDQECRLKDHWSGVCRELAGILDLWAGNDPERFVIAKVPALTARCKKFKAKSKLNQTAEQDRPRYSQTAVEKALSEFRRRGVITEQLRRVRDGIERKGFIVKAHDKLAACIEGKCCWQGFTPHSAQLKNTESTEQSMAQCMGQSTVESTASSMVAKSGQDFEG